VGRLALRIAAGIVTAAAVGTLGLLALAFGPTLFGGESMIVTSGSMGNAMPVGSVAVTRLVDARAIAVGDVITFRLSGARVPTTHRVAQVLDRGDERVFRTKGDANPALDPDPVRVRDRVNRVEHVVPLAGWVAGYARTPVGAILLLLVPAAGLFVDRRRARAARPAGPGSVLPVAAPASPSAGQPAALTAAVIGAVFGGLAAGVLLRRADHHGRRRPRIAS
jgi:signal peptidase I